MPLLFNKWLFVAITLTSLFCWKLGVTGIMSQGYTINTLALEVMQSCQNNALINRGDFAEPLTNQTAWLVAAATHCQGNEAESHAFWKDALAFSDERLPALRGLLPSDVELALYATALYPERGDAFFWLGDAYEEGADVETAVQAYEQGLELDPSDGLIWRKVGDFHQANGDWQLAVHAFDQACFRIDRGKNGCPRAATIYMQQGQYELAAQRYRQSLEQLPNWPPAQKGLAAALIALERPEEAVPYLQKLVAKGDTEAAQLLEQIEQQQ